MKKKYNNESGMCQVLTDHQRVLTDTETHTHRRTARALILARFARTHVVLKCFVVRPVSQSPRRSERMSHSAERSVSFNQNGMEK